MELASIFAMEKDKRLSTSRLLKAMKSWLNIFMVSELQPVSLTIKTGRLCIWVKQYHLKSNTFKSDSIFQRNVLVSKIKIVNIVAKLTYTIPAAENGHANIIELLADKFKASIFERTKDGSTLMHIASLNGHADCAMMLFKKGVYLHMPNKVCFNFLSIVFFSIPFPFVSAIFIVCNWICQHIFRVCV